MKIEQLFHCEEYDIPKEALSNLNILLKKLQMIEDQYGAMVVTNGFRTFQEHKDIYRRKNDALLLAGKKEVPIPLHSNHLTGRAADIFDPTGLLKEWISMHMDVVEKADLYMEGFRWTPRYVHFQSVPPASKNRFYSPY